LSDVRTGTPLAARGGGAGLPITGPDLPLQVAAGGLLLLVGAAVLVLARRRTRAVLRG
jgi:LPXTG-motif cell wall-anchored protein